MSSSLVLKALADNSVQYDTNEFDQHAGYEAEADVEKIDLTSEDDRGLMESVSDVLDNRNITARCLALAYRSYYSDSYYYFYSYYSDSYSY